MRKKLFYVCFGLIVLGLSGCGHEHTWIEATCTEPKTCFECGETEGEPLGHVWEEATCTKPKTCLSCGATEGEALGHSIDVGKCSVCGEVVNGEVFLQLCEDIKKVEHPKAEHITGDSIESMYPGCVKVYDEAVEAAGKYKQIIDDYSEYEGLKDIRDAMNAIVNSVPSKPTKTVDGINGFLDGMSNYMYKCRDLEMLISNTANSFV